MNPPDQPKTEEPPSQYSTTDRPTGNTTLESPFFLAKRQLALKFLFLIKNKLIFGDQAKIKILPRIGTGYVEIWADYPEDDFSFHATISREEKPFRFESCKITIMNPKDTLNPSIILKIKELITPYLETNEYLSYSVEVYDIEKNLFRMKVRNTSLSVEFEIDFALNLNGEITNKNGNQDIDTYFYVRKTPKIKQEMSRNLSGETFFWGIARAYLVNTLPNFQDGKGIDHKFLLITNNLARIRITKTITSSTNTGIVTRQESYILDVYSTSSGATNIIVQDYIESINKISLKRLEGKGSKIEIINVHVGPKYIKVAAKVDDKVYYLGYTDDETSDEPKYLGMVPANEA